MTDFQDFREPNRESSFIRPVDSIARDAVRRSRGSTHHSQSHPSVSASTRSWVYTTQQNPPPAPAVEAIQVSAPIRPVRPLPDPHLVQQQQLQQRYATNATSTDAMDDDEEYMNIDPDVPGLEAGYRTEGLGRGKRPGAASPGSGEETEGGGSSREPKSFVGGFVSGLKRFPRAIFRYGNAEKRKPVRKGTFGTDGGTSVTGMTSGNTLPRYVSTPPPVAGPSGVQYVQATEMPIPNLAPTDVPAGTQRRRHPSFRITPPSEIVEQEETSQYDYPPPNPPSELYGHTASPDPPPPEQSDARTSVHYDPPDPVHPATSRSHSQSLHQRASTVVPDPVPPLDVAPVSQSPVVAHPAPTADYLRMSLTPSRRTTHHTDLTSVTGTSGPSFSSELSPVHRFFHTIIHMPWVSTERVTVDYQPGPNRTGKTGGGGGGAHTAPSAKKPMSSWYTFEKIRSGRRPKDVDLTNGGTISRRTSRVTRTGTSTGTGTPSGTSLSSPLVSSTPRRARRSRSSSHIHHNHRHRSHSHHHHRRRRETTSTNNDPPPLPHHAVSNSSPLIPHTYPYAYPYPYPYPTYPSPQSAHNRSGTYTPHAPRTPPYSPRDHPHRTPTYPHGYAPFPPSAQAPTVYVIQTPPGGSTANDAGASQNHHGHGQGQAPMYMQVVPGAFGPQEGAAYYEHAGSPLARAPS